MQTATASYYATPMPSMHPYSQAQSLNHNHGNGNGTGAGVNGSGGGVGGGSGSILLPSPSEPLRASVTHLLARAYNLPCTAAAQAFTQLVQPTARFQLALEALLPLLSGNAEVPQRILASYILYSLYATHPITMNPFRTAFIDVFSRERDLAKVESERGGVSDNEQLVWVLWKILKGDGTDLGPYSPVTLARSPIPPKLRAPYLTVDDAPLADLDQGKDSGDQSFHSFSTKNSGSSMSISSVGSNGAQTPMPPDQISSASPVGSTALNRTNYGLGNGSVSDERVTQAMNLLVSATTRVLSLVEQKIVLTAIPQLPNTILSANDIPSVVAFNPTIAHPYIVSVLRTTSEWTIPDAAHHTFAAYLDALRKLHPTLTTFDVLGRLLRESTPLAGFGDESVDGMGATTTIAQLIRSEVLGIFILNAIEWIEKAERDEMEGLISDDRAAKAVQSLCRFFNSLIKLNIVDAASDTDSAAMAHFALNHSRFEEANALYRVLIMSKF